MQCNKFVISNWAASALTNVYTLIRRSTLTSSQTQKCITIIPMWALLENFPQSYMRSRTPPPTAVLLFCYYVRHLTIWRLHIPAKLKQEGQKYIFQFSRCESFHLVIQMSLVFCVNRCPHPASFISIS